jgi:hypothetical protein
LNPRPLGYEPSELPNCSTPRRVSILYEGQRVLANPQPGRANRAGPASLSAVLLARLPG